MASKAESTDLAIQAAPPDLSIFGGERQVFACNIPATGRELWKLVAKMQGSGIESLRKHIGEVIPMAYWFVHKVKVNSMKDGVAVDAIRTVIGTETGELYDSVANGVAQSLAVIVQINGNGILQPPLKVIASEVETRAGFDTLILEPAPE